MRGTEFLPPLTAEVSLFQSRGHYRAAAKTSGVTGGLAETATVQPQQVGCYAAGCNGKDPHDMGCDLDAVTIQTVSTGGEGDLSLRWSNACQANWARVQNVGIFGTNFWVENKVGNKQTYGWGFAGPASGWSNMVNGHNILDRACTDGGCTGWH
jgi:hypothetical protein